MLMREKYPQQGESKLAVCSIKRILLRRQGRVRKVEPEMRRRRLQAIPISWVCGTALPRRKGSGMLAQYLWGLGRSHIISKALSWNIAEVQSSGGIT
jgi:hypothetical protein